MKKLLLSLCLLCSSAGLLAAHAIAGRWTATVETDNGPFTFTVIYQVKGDQLSGTFISDWGERTFRNGSISGNEFSYTYKTGGRTITHQGKLVGSQIEITWSGEGIGRGRFTLRRVE